MNQPIPWRYRHHAPVIVEPLPPLMDRLSDLVHDFAASLAFFAVIAVVLYVLIHGIAPGEFADGPQPY